MTADDLLKLVNRYVEACDDLGDGLFEKPLSTTDALHAKATELHSQIKAEVTRLHAEADSLRVQLAHWRVFGEHAEGERSRLQLEVQKLRAAAKGKPPEGSA